MQWLIESKEWLFSGIGVLLISIIFTFLKRKKDHITQSIKDSDRNVNIQAGDNTNITLGTSDKEEPKKDLNPCLNPHAKYVDNLTDYFEGCDDKTPAKI